MATLNLQLINEYSRIVRDRQTGHATATVLATIMAESKTRFAPRVYTHNTPSPSLPSSSSSSNQKKPETNISIMESSTAQQLEKREQDAELPVDVVVIADRSDSMKTIVSDGKQTRVQVVKHITQALARILNPKHDRLGLISFGSMPWVRFDLLHTPNLELINSLDAPEMDGQTDVGAALSAAFSLFGPGQDRIKAIFLLTDGDATEGDTELEDLVRLVKYNCPEDVRVHTFGIGADHKASVLAALAEARYGHYAYINDTEEALTRAFAASLGAMRSVVARNVTLSLTTGTLKEARFIRVESPYACGNDDLGNRETITEPVMIHFKSLSAGERRDILLTVEIKGPMMEHPAPLLSAVLGYQAMPSLQQITFGPLRANPVRFLSMGAVVTAEKPNAQVTSQRQRLRVVQGLQAESVSVDMLEQLAQAMDGEQRQDLAGLVRQQASQLRDSEPGASHSLYHASQSLSQQQAQGTPAQERAFEQLSQQMAWCPEEERPRKRQRRLLDDDGENACVSAGSSAFNSPRPPSQPDDDDDADEDENVVIVNSDVQQGPLVDYDYSANQSQAFF